MKEVIIKKTLDITAHLIKDYNWTGACYATSAINYILLKEQGVISDPKLGVVVVDDNVFDHAWIEIDDSVYDVAISAPLKNDFSHIFDVDGLRGEIESEVLYKTGNSTICYGIERDVDPDILIALKTFGFFMTKNSPSFDKSIDYWQLTVKLGQKLNLSLNKESLIKEYSDHKWIVI